MEVRDEDGPWGAPGCFWVIPVLLGVLVCSGFMAWALPDLFVQEPANYLDS